MKDRLVIGIVRTSFGVRGELKIASVSGETDHFRNLRSVTIRKKHTEREYDVESVRTSAGAPILKLAGIETPETARTLNGAEVLADRDHAAPCEEGEYYVADLEELSVRLHDASIGTVSGVVEVGPRSLLQIRLTDGRSVLVPFVDEFVGRVDLDAGTVELLSDTVLE